MPDLTRDTILAMEAGPEIRRLVAELLGWQIGALGGAVNISPSGSRWSTCNAPWEGVPDYPTDIAAAWEVVTSLVKPGHYNELSYHHDGENLDEPNLRAFMSMSLRDSYCVCATAPTAPLAVCRAALLTTLEAKDVTDAQFPVGTT